MNILSLQVFPHVGRVTDELLLAVPGGWDASDVRTLVVASGGDRVAVSRCSARDLVDAPTRYLRVARQLLERPNALSEALEELLDVRVWSDHRAEEDSLSVDVAGSTTEIRRGVPFTESERARAAALAEFPQLALTRSVGGGRMGDDPTPVRPSDARWSVRDGRPSDAAMVRRMHERCSAETLVRRYHTPMRRVPQRLEHLLLSPRGGASFVAVVADEVVGMAVVAPYEEEVMEVGILVEDGWQRRGIGSNLLHTAALHGAGQQKAAMRAMMPPDNRALLATVRRCGLNCRVRTVDGAAHLMIPLAQLIAGAQKPGSRLDAAKQAEAASAHSAA